MAVNIVKEAIRSGDIDALDEDRLEELGIDANSELGEDGFTPVHWACHYGRAEILQYFLDKGGDINKKTKQGWTGGHVCAIRGCTVCLQVLCSSSLDLSAADSRGYTCAHLAAAHGKCSALQAILKTGENIERLDQRGWSVLHHAAYHGRLGIIQLVIKYEIDPNREDKVGNTPAHLAASEGHLECLKVLVYHRKQPLEVVTCRNNNGATPKDLAVQFQKQDCVDFLTSAEIEADIFEYNEGDEYPAHAAAHEGNVELLGMLIHEGHCGVNDRDHMGSTPAHKAAGNGHTKCLQWLIDHGANVSIKDNSGETPKDVAIRFAHVGCVALLAKGMNFDSDEECGEIPDRPTPKALGRAREKVDELQELLGAAKARFRQLGGELPEDRELELMKDEHKQELSELETRLTYERERRERLEAELDQLRKQLQHTSAELLHTQSLLRQYKATPTLQHSTSEHSRGHRSKHRSHSKRKTPDFRGGAFVRIDHI